MTHFKKYKIKTAFHKENIVVLSILCIICTICFYDVVFLGKTFKLTTGNPQALLTGPYGQQNNRPAFYPAHSTDVPVFEEPIMKFIKNSFKEGIFPLWNPHQACGVPLVGMIQTGILFPLNLILYLLPNTIAWDVLIFSRFLLAGILSYWFMRTMKFQKIPSIGSAVAFMISAPMILSHWSFAHVDILLPLLLLTIERILQTPSLKNTGFLAIAVGLTCFAGNPEHIVLVNGYAFLFFCFRFFTIGKTKNRLRIFFYFILAYLWGCCLAAVVLFPFLQNWLTEFWHAHADFIGAVPEGIDIRAKTLINFVMPSFFQKEIVTLGFERSTLWGHIGIVPLGLAFLSLFNKHKKGLNYFFAGMALIFFLKSYTNFPLTNWTGYLPVLRNCRFIHHTHYLFFFSIMMMAGMGIRSMMLCKQVFWKGFSFAAVLFTLMGIALHHYRKAAHFDLSLQSFVLASVILTTFLILLFLKDRRSVPNHVCVAGIIFLLIFELFYYIPRAGRVNRFNSFPKVPYIEYLKNQPGRSRVYGVFWYLYPNTASGYGIDDFGIVEGLLLKRYVAFINNFVIPDYFNKENITSAFWVIPASFKPASRPYLDLLNLKYTIAPTSLSYFFIPAENPGFPRPIYHQEASIYAHRKTLPRAFIVHKALFEPDETRSIEIMKKIASGFDKIVLLQAEPVPEIQQQLRHTPLMSDSSIDIISYTPNKVVMRAHMTVPGFLVFGDNYHPDWKVSVNGKPKRIFLADTLIRAVFLPAGDHTVTFKFQPVWFFIGLFLTGMALVLTLIFFLNKFLKNFRR